jgi:phenylpropionate dioxygenase-like ring-hydroxylating dioxygenase large terminal subunit
MSNFLMNAWYVAAWSEEVQPDLPFARTLLGRKIAFFRKGDGTLVALADRCPHRFASLSGGEVRDDCIACPYHGLTFDASGDCVDSPLTGHVPRGAHVPVFPVAERDSLAWFWPGDPDQADTSQIPAYDFLLDPARHVMRGHLTAATNYELCVDNLMDLSHVQFVHASSISRHWDRFKRATYSAHQHDGVIHALINYAGVGPIPDDPAGTEPYDVFLDMAWKAPSCMELNAGSKPAGTPIPRYSDPAVHIVTPESATTTHYFWSSTRTHYDSPDAERLRREALIKAFVTEDKPLLEMIQQNMVHENFWDEKPIVLPSDAGAIQVRRALQKRIAGERALIRS